MVELAWALDGRITALRTGSAESSPEGLRAIRRGLEVSEDVAGIWLPASAALRLESGYTPGLVDTTRAQLGPVAAYEDLLRNVRLRSRFESDAGLADAIDDRVLEGARQHAPTDLTVALTTARADLRRLQGDFAGALEDLDRARDLCASGLASTAAVTHMLRSQLKVEIDLGRLERARELVVRIDAVAATLGPKARPETALQNRLSKLLYLSTFRRPGPVRRMAQVVLGELEALGSQRPSVLRLQAMVTGHKALAQALEARRPGASAAMVASAAEAVEDALDTELLDPSLRLTLELHRILWGPEMADLEQAGARLERAIEIVEGVRSPLRRGTTAALVHQVARDRRQSTARERAEAIMREAAGPIAGAWESVAGLPGGVGFLEFADRQRFVAELIEARLLRDDVRGAFADLLTFDACSSIAVGRGAEPDLDAVLALAQDHGATVVAALPTEESTHLLRFGPEEGRDGWHLRHHRGPGLLELGPLIDAHRRAVETPPATPGDEDDAEVRRWVPAPASLALGEALLGEVLAAEPGGDPPLWLSGLERLRIIAPSALRLREGGEPIGLQRPVSLVPSLSALPSLVPGARARGTTVFGLSGVPHGLARIDLTDAEQAALEGSCPGPMKWVLGHDATPARLVETLSAPAALAVVWTHGVAVKGRDYPTALVTAPVEDTLRTRKVFGADVRDALGRPRGSARGPEVAILCCCDSGAGKRRTGDPAAGHFVGILLGGGSSCVLASPTDLHRDATAALLTAFALSWAEDGTTVAGALLEARRSMVRAHPHHRAPHYWAGLEVHGLGSLTH